MRPNPMTGVLIKERKFGGGRGTLGERQRGCSDASTSHGMPRDIQDGWQLPEARRGKEGSPLEAFAESTILPAP